MHHLAAIASIYISIAHHYPGRGAVCQQSEQARRGGPDLSPTIRHRGRMPDVNILRLSAASFQPCSPPRSTPNPQFIYRRGLLR